MDHRLTQLFWWFLQEHRRELAQAGPVVIMQLERQFMFIPVTTLTPFVMILPSWNFLQVSLLTIQPQESPTLKVDLFQLRRTRFGLLDGVILTAQTRYQPT